MSDPVLDIAESIKTYLEAVRGTQTTSSFVVQLTSTPNDFLFREEHRWEKTVLIIPYGIVATRIGRAGQAVETYQVNVIVTEKLETQVSERELHELTREITLLLRRFRPAPEKRASGYGWSSDETVSRCDPDLLERSNVFASLTRFGYDGTA